MAALKYKMELNKRRTAVDFPHQIRWLVDGVILSHRAEIALSVLSNKCLNRRIGDEAVLKRAVLALEGERNEAGAVIDWRISTQYAPTKSQHIYPAYSELIGTSTSVPWSWLTPNAD